jgi:hypothetical protein
MKKHHDISNVKFENGFLMVTVNGKLQKVPLKKASPILEKATEEERNRFEISPSGYGIHWPLLDEDLSIDGLLGNGHAPQVTASAVDQGHARSTPKRSAVGT